MIVVPNVIARAKWMTVTELQLTLIDDRGMERIFRRPVEPVTLRAGDEAKITWSIKLEE